VAQDRSGREYDTHRMAPLLQARGRPVMSQKFLFNLDPVRFFLGSLAIGLAFGFPRYFGHWVYFPWFPNIIDSATMALLGLVLLWDVARSMRR